ncbi:hypothetical protein AHAS_Ahas10G0108500 [Arachis hypogaea]
MTIDMPPSVAQSVRTNRSSFSSSFGHEDNTPLHYYSTVTNGDGYESDSSSFVPLNASNSNEQHDMEVNSACVAAEEDVAKNHKDLFEQFDVIENLKCRKQNIIKFISRMFAILMKMLLDIEDDPAWHSAETEDEDADESSNYSIGQECLDRLSISLGGNTIVPVASEQLPAYSAAPEWQKRHAALIALAQIAEGCSKVVNMKL